MKYAMHWVSGLSVMAALFALPACNWQAGDTAAVSESIESSQAHVAQAEVPTQTAVTAQDQAQAFISLLGTHGEGLSWDGLQLGMPEADVARHLGGALQLLKSEDNPYADDEVQEHCGNHTVQSLPVSLCFIEFEGAKTLSGVALHLSETPLEGSQIAQLKAFAQQRMPELKLRCPDCELQRGHEMVAIKSAGLSWTVPVDLDADY